MKKNKNAAPIVDHPGDAQRAQEAIRKDPEAPENYTALASSLRLHAQAIRERTPEAADNLLKLACAAAWEAKRRSTAAMISGRTKQEVKILSAWVRTRNHLTPEAAESAMEEIRAARLAEAVDSPVAFADAGSP
jgi:hypothetical protein